MAIELTRTLSTVHKCNYLGQPNRSKVTRAHVRAAASKHLGSEFFAVKSGFIDNLTKYVFFRERYHHSKKSTPFYIQPLPVPRYDFRNINKSNLNKFSISALSLPPVGLFPTEEKNDKLPAIAKMYNFHSDEEEIIQEEMYNLTDIDDIVDVVVTGEKRHHSLEYLDDFYPIEEHTYFDDILDDETSEPHQMTTTTTLASFRNSQPKSHHSRTTDQSHSRSATSL